MSESRTIHRPTVEIEKTDLFEVTIRYYPNGKPVPEPVVVLEIDAREEVADDAE